MTFLYILILSLHLLCVGIAGMGPLVAFCWDMRHRNKDDESYRLVVRDISAFSINFLILTTITGMMLTTLFVFVVPNKYLPENNGRMENGTAIFQNVTEVMSGFV